MVFKRSNIGGKQAFTQRFWIHPTDVIWDKALHKQRALEPKKTFAANLWKNNGNKSSAYTRYRLKVSIKVGNDEFG